MNAAAGIFRTSHNIMHAKCVITEIRAVHDMFPIIHAAVGLSLHTVTVSAEREDGPTPGARVTWSTTVPPECVASVTVEFRTSSSGNVVRSYTTTSETEVIQTGLQCETTYFIRVVVTGVTKSPGTLRSNQVPVFVGGKIEVTAMHMFIDCDSYVISQIYQSQS